MIYAIFLCMQATGTCTIQDVPHPAPDPMIGTTSTFTSLRECQRYARQMTGRAGTDIPADGRFMLATAGPAAWYQCLGKHVEEWH